MPATEEEAVAGGSRRREQMVVFVGGAGRDRSPECNAEAESQFIVYQRPVTTSV